MLEVDLDSGLRQSLDRISDGFFTVDRDWRYTYLNRSAEEYLGRRREELLGRVMWEVFPETVGTQVERMYREAAAAGQPVETELFGPLRKRWVAVRVFPSPDGVAVSFRDVTDRREAEEALRAGEARYRALFENSLDGVFLTSPDGGILAANPAGCRMLQRTEAEICAIGRAGVVDFEDPRSRAFLEQRRLTGGARGEVTLIRKDGSRFPVEAVSSVFVDGEGRSRTSMSIHDLTERKRTETALRLLTDAGRVLPEARDVEAMLAALARLVVPAFADVFVVDRVDGDGDALERMVDAGDGSAPRRFRIARAATPPRCGTGHVLATGEAELVPVLDDAWWREAAEDDEQRRGASALGLASAILVPLVARGTTIGVLAFLGNARRRRYDDADLAVARDLAERAALALDNLRLYREAVDARLRRDEMLGVVSHDLRSPLNAIRLSAEMLGRRSPGQWVTAIVGAVARADRLVQDLLAITAIESGRLPLEPAPEAIGEVIDEVAELHRGLADARGIAIETRCQDGLPTCRIDRHRVVQALSNLLGNAIKFSPARSTIEIAASGTGDAIEIAVIDHGPGIAPEALPHVFDRFWRASADEGGVGLGLAIASGIAAAHGGTLRVASRLGEGATFTLSLPLG